MDWQLGTCLVGPNSVAPEREIVAALSDLDPPVVGAEECVSTDTVGLYRLRGGLPAIHVKLTVLGRVGADIRAVTAVFWPGILEKAPSPDPVRDMCAREVEGYYRLRDFSRVRVAVRPVGECWGPVGR
jgi:hypothetical protein